MQTLMAFLTGLIFGLGLILSGMTNPAKVIGFLDVAGAWNPSLLFVMGGAIFIAAIAFHLVNIRPKSLLGGIIHLPTARQIDRRLALGGLTFGVGWGIAGYCPGPALASLTIGESKPLIFVVAMLVGMAIFEIHDRHSAPRKRKVI
jgi:uncharacterized membrane protein YedE/YeeE